MSAAPLNDTARGLLHVVLYEAAAQRSSYRDAAASPHLSAEQRELCRQRSLDHDEAGRQLVVLCGCEAYCQHLFPTAQEGVPK